ncbi:MAG: acyl--CoA ligase [Oscillospiraceae bacterium]|nr:acyl--CoA ligase [Oscillospiraceae bacterium]
MELWKYLKNKMQLNLQQKICENNASITFEEMIVFAENFSKKLKGIQCCAILCQSEMAASMALLSCFAAQVTALPLSQRYGELHCNKILDAISPNAVITDQGGELHVIYIKDSVYTQPNVHPALIMCTSGTTGAPKGAMLTETNVVTNVSDIALYFGMKKSDTILISRPLYHCAVLTGEFLTALVKGVKIRFYSGTFNPVILLKLLKEHNITTFCGTPTLLSMMARFKRRQEDCLKHICISGECMSFETGKRIAEAFPNAEIYHIYGLTEACPRVSYLPPSMFAQYADCVGLPLRSVFLKVIAPDGKPVDLNEIGTLWVKGDNVMVGYYNDPAKTSEVLKDGWLCTGDLATFNESGLLKIKGRQDNLIIKAGMNIYPQEVEDALKADPRVREVCVWGDTNSETGTQIVLDIAGDFADVSEVKELCRIYLPTYQMPTRIHLLDELPKNGSGKIIRRQGYA